MKKASLALLGVFCILLAVIAVRTLNFTSRQINTPPIQQISLSRDAVSRLSEAIQYRTITNQASAGFESGEMQRFQDFLTKSFPRVHELLLKETIGGHSLLYSWKGKDERLKPTLFRARGRRLHLGSGHDG